MIQLLSFYGLAQIGVFCCGLFVIIFEGLYYYRYGLLNYIIDKKENFNIIGGIIFHILGYFIFLGLLPIDTFILLVQLAQWHPKSRENKCKRKQKEICQEKMSTIHDCYMVQAQKIEELKDEIEQIKANIYVGK